MFFSVNEGWFVKYSSVYVTHREILSVYRKRNEDVQTLIITEEPQPVKDPVLDCYPWLPAKGLYRFVVSVSQLPVSLRPSLRIC